MKAIQSYWEDWIDTTVVPVLRRQPLALLSARTSALGNSSNQRMDS